MEPTECPLHVKRCNSRIDKAGDEGRILPWIIIKQPRFGIYLL